MGSKNLNEVDPDLGGREISLRSSIHEMYAVPGDFHLENSTTSDTVCSRTASSHIIFKEIYFALLTAWLNSKER